MRIGMMADMYKPHISGVTNYIELNKRAYESAGHQVYVFTFGDEDFQDDEQHIIRSPSLPLGYRYGEKDFKVGLRYSKEAQRLLQTMDIVHTHHPFISGTLALRYARPRRIPVVFTNHTRIDIYMQVYVPQLPGSVGRAFLETYLPNFCRSCDLVISPSKSLEVFLRQVKVGSPIEIIPNGIDLSPFRESSTGVSREDFGFREDDILLLYVGRISGEKNLNFLIRSFHGISQAFENVRLMVVGDGPDLEDLQSRVREMGIGPLVHFTGLVPYKETPAYFRLADIFVTSSISEVHPLSVIEAMASGLPVVGVGEGGVGDTVEDGATGFLAPNEIAAYTSKLVRLIVEKDLRLSMSAEAMKSSEKYNIQKTSELVFSHYLKLLASSRDHRRGLRSFLTRTMTGLGRRWTTG
jgi:glycosyltransferase involved in cell wall biosynthesis